MNTVITWIVEFFELLATLDYNSPTAYIIIAMIAGSLVAIAELVRHIHNLIFRR